ncbi:MAG: multidrug transporter MATE [Blautia marasmi]
MKQTENIMGTKKVLPLLVSMSIPPMVSMMIQALYNIVDSMYVARISENALTAVSGLSPPESDPGSVRGLWHWSECLRCQGFGGKKCKRDRGSGSSVE